MVKGVQKSVVASPRECAINGLLAAAAVGYGAMDSFSAHRPVHCAHTIGKSSLVRSLVLGKIRAKATAGRRVARVQPGSRIGMISLLTMSLLAAGMLPAQNLKMNTCGGAVGQNLQIDVTNGQANAVLLHVMSLQRALIPLSLIDPSESRSLGLQPDLVLINLLDAAGSYSTVFSIPNNPALSGTLVHQALTLVGLTLAFDEVSEVVTTPYGIGTAFVAEPVTMAFDRTFSTAVPLAGGNVLICGGGSGQLLFQNGSATTEIWDPVSRTVQPGPSMTSARSAHTMTQLQDGRYLFVGGVSATNVPQASCEVFDPQSNTFTAVASMGAIRAHHTATLLSDGRVLIAGGIQNMSNGTLAVTSSTATTTIFNPTSNTWAAGPNLSRPRGAHMAVHLGNGKVLICGGLSYTSFFGFLSPNIQARGELFDEITNTLTATPNMATQRALAGAFLLPNGRALVVGGMTGNVAAGGVPTALCETYNPATNSWATSPARAVPLAVPRCVTLADGTIISVGGAGGDLYVPLPSAACETVDPVTGVWSSLPALTIGRASPMVVPLQSCSVAVFGGSATNLAVSSNSIELLIR